ncbi:sodium-independent sulfate anion transporter isoform X2 [Tribolium castaneum]|uniref:sodium-independent sulfate anion transporter isoform X2 n=1 Tax=Tribolium castaneum TaxID=7070 RepID=UPI00077DC478|nr:PREDICTED: sodium-independent sulfate anion transporter isoform X2 [Tribolium castaneum]|eukprot:XP_015838459.1 PREDICTED: sodium-independent sulfate anion transporter isoform X2 [Tribolium castaneum]
MEVKTESPGDPNDRNGNVHKNTDLTLPHDFINNFASNNTTRKKIKKILIKRIPILSWLPEYNCDCAVGDLVAGITVGLTVIPQALAYSSVAGLPPQYGLYTSFLGCFVYIFLGSCKDVAMGPTAILALLVHQVTEGKGPEYAILLCLLSGIVQLLMGVLGLGFTSAAALIIVSSQIKDLLGIRASGANFLDIWEGVVKDIGNTKVWDCVLGIACLVVLLLLRIISTVGTPETGVPKWRTALRLIGISRNAILVIVCGAIGYYFTTLGETPFKVIGYVPEGFPAIQPPRFTYTYNNTHENFLDMVTNLRSGIIIVPLLGLLEDIAVCKAFANGRPVDATQELLAIGLCNVANSFVQGFPGSGALARSAVNNSSGVKTTLGGLYTGVIVITALFFFTPYFQYIPKATLAAIIIAAAIFMVEIRVIQPMWRAKKSDLALALITFVTCLVTRLEYGISTGVVLNIIFILYQAARPKITIETMKSTQGADYLLVTPDRCLIFPSADYVRNLVIKQSMRQKIPVVIDCSHIYGADYTAATVIESLTKDFKTRQQPLFFYNLKSSVSSVFVGLNLDYFLVYYNEDELDDMLKKWTEICDKI